MEYKTILYVIKAEPKHFILTCLWRSQTTPNQTNKTNHLIMAAAINSKKWDIVIELLESSEYRKPLDGVVYCLGNYSDITSQTHHIM